MELQQNKRNEKENSDKEKSPVDASKDTTTNQNSSNAPNNADGTPVVNKKLID